MNKTYNSSQFHDIFVHFFKVFPDFKSGATVYSRQRVHFRGRTSQSIHLSQKMADRPGHNCAQVRPVAGHRPPAATTALQLRCGVCSTFGEGDDSPADLRDLTLTEMRHAKLNF